MINQIIGWYLFIGFIDAIVEVKYMIKDDKKYSFFDYFFVGYVNSQLFWFYGLYNILKGRFK